MSAAISHQAGAPAFDAEFSTVLPRSAFSAALDEIRQWDGYTKTPLYSLPALAQELDLGAIRYKHEGPRFGLGSFKALGGAYGAQCALRRELSRITGSDVTLAEIRNGDWVHKASQITLVSATDGNHGRSLAWGCKRFGAQCRIYIHAEVSAGREQAIEDLGATVVRVDGDYDASVAICRDEALENGWIVVSDTSWDGYTEIPRDVMAGYGVMFSEIVDQMGSAPSHAFVQGGVGGLAAAASASLRQLWGREAPRIVVVEPEYAACLFECAARGTVTVVEIEAETIMAGLSCGEPSPLAWDVLAGGAADFLTISDGLIPPTMRRLARPRSGDPAIEGGESGVAGLAALIEAGRSELLRESIGLTSESEVLLIGTEGVTDPQIFAEILAAE